MSYVIADPEIMTSAASDLARIGSDLSAAHAAAATRTLAVIPAAADEVSTGIAQLFSGYGRTIRRWPGRRRRFRTSLCST
jgi:hypothetical protein